MRSLDIAGFEHLYQDRAGVEDSALGTGVIYAFPGFSPQPAPGLVSGREFSDADVAGAPLVAIISETIARQFFAGRDPIGLRIGSRRTPGADGDRRRKRRQAVGSRR